MPRELRKWHPCFLQYMETIVNHPNYKGLPIEKKADGTYNWIATAKSRIGQSRIAWCIDKAKELGIEDKPGVYADVMLAIHPTKWKVCQTCGRSMSLYYHYPNVHFLNAINCRFGTDFTLCDHVSDIWDELISNGFRHNEIAELFIKKGSLNLPVFSSKDDIIDALEYACRKGSKSCLGPGAMSNFPDRFDGFHTYNRCCRALQDKGRSKENLKTYTKDRRAYECWSDGNIHAANQFMGSPYFDGISADHIGPISLGFVHDPRYLQPMEGGDNSSKRDRLQLGDIEKILETERRTMVYPMSWYSKEIWEFIKSNYRSNTHKIGSIYRDALKQNMANFMYILWYILKRCPITGESFLIGAFLEPNFACFNYSYSFDGNGEIVEQIPRHFTDRSKKETERYCRIAINAVYDYRNKGNRNTAPYLTSAEKASLEKICGSINSGFPVNIIKQKIVELITHIQNRIIARM